MNSTVGAKAKPAFSGVHGRPPIARQKYWNKRGNGAGGEWDVVVIGSGMGGMTAAAILSQLGKRVLVLEQNHVPGGFTQTFKRKQYRWDVGVHVVGEVTEDLWNGRLLSSLTNGRLAWESLGDTYDEFVYPDAFRIAFPDCGMRKREVLEEAFPQERKAIAEYYKLTKKASDVLGLHFVSGVFPGRWGRLAKATLARPARRFLQRTVAEVAEELTDDHRLQALFSAQWGYYGSLPSETSFGVQAALCKHYEKGGYYPVGGAREIAQELLRTVADAGGWTRISTSVDEILMHKGRAIGVRLDDGEEIRAKSVVSAIGAVATAQHLLPQSQSESSWAKGLKQLSSSPAHVCLYIGFKGDITKAGASAANVWLNSSWKVNQRDWDLSTESLGDAPCFYCSFPSLKDPTHQAGPEQYHTGELVSFVSWDDFKQWTGTRWKRRGDGYLALKEKMTQAMLDRLLQHMPGLAPMIDYVELSTPLSTDRFCRSTRGSIYGLAPTPERYRSPWLQASSPVPGLYLAGCDLVLGGVMGAMMGGVFGAAAVSPFAASRYYASLARGKALQAVS